MTTRKALSSNRKYTIRRTAGRPSARAYARWGAARGRQGHSPIVPVRISSDFTNAFTRSAAEAERLTSELLTSTRSGKERLADAGELVNWVSVSGNLQQRQALIAGFRKARADLPLIHHMAKLPRAQTAEFMKDYFAKGGSMAAVVQWLAIVGNLRRAARQGTLKRALVPARRMLHRRDRARGLFDDPIGFLGNVWDDTKDLVSKGGSAIVDAVGAVVDSVVKAGKSLGDAIGAAVNWSIGEVTDLVDSLIDAGKKVADILAAAATKGIEQLKKYVQAVLAAGRSVAEVLAWAAMQATAAVNAAVAKLIELGRSVLDIVKSAISLTRTALTNVIKALIAAGKTLANLLAALANEALSVMKPFIDALLAAGQTLKNVLIEAAKLAATACRTVLQALIGLGKALVDMLREVAAVVGNTLQVIAQNLLALGTTLAQILAAAAGLAATAVTAVIKALLAIGKTVADMVVAVANQTMKIMKVIFTAMIAGGIKLLEILVGLCGRTLSALRTALEALVAMGISLAVLVGNICTGVEAAFRRGFFEGLVALGKTPLQLLKAAAEYRVSTVLLAFTVILEMFGGYKPLHQIPGALDEAKQMFGTTIALERVQVGFAQLPNDVIRYVNLELPRAFTTMYLLNFGPGAAEKMDMRTIIHELAHVWQGVQDGPLYMTRALEAQMGAGFDALFHKGKYDDRRAYAVNENDLIANKGDLSRFNPEQQAIIAEHFWLGRFSRHMARLAIASGFDKNETLLPDSALLPYVQKINPRLGPAAKIAGRQKATPAPRNYRRPAASPAVAYA